MDKVGETATLEEVTTEEEKSKAMLFLLRVYESRYGKLFEDMSKADFVGKDEYPETINGAYELLVLASRQFGGIILRGGRRNFRNELGHGGRTSVVFTQTRGKRGERNYTSGSNLFQVDPVSGN